MRFNYYPDTDSLYIALSEKQSRDAKEVAPNIVFDYDENGNVVGIDIFQYASTIVDLASLEIHSLPQHAVAA